MADLVELAFKAQTRELDQAQKKLQDVGKAAETAQTKASGLTGALDRFKGAGGPISDAANRVQGLSDQVGDAVGSFGKLGGAVAIVGAGAIAAAAGVVKLALSVANAADELNDMANRTNISTERLSLLDAAAKMAGSSAEELVSSSEKLGSKLAKQDEESGKVITALRELGIATKDANGETKSMLQLQEDIVLAVDKAANSAEAEGKALALLGPAYYKIRTAVKETFAAKSEMYDYMAKTGQITTTKLAKDSDTLNDSISKLGGAFTGIGNSIASAVIPALTSVVVKIGEISAVAADIIRRYTGGETAAEAVGDALSNLQKIRKNAENTIAKIEGTAYAETAGGAKALAQAKERVTAINEEIREMQRLKSGADAAAAAIKAAVIDGAKGEGNKPAPGSGNSSGNADPMAWMKDPSYADAYAKALDRSKAKNDEFNSAIKAASENYIKGVEQESAALKRNELELARYQEAGNRAVAAQVQRNEETRIAQEVMSRYGATQAEVTSAIADFNVSQAAAELAIAKARGATEQEVKILQLKLDTLQALSQEQKIAANLSVSAPAPATSPSQGANNALAGTGIQLDSLKFFTGEVKAEYERMYAAIDALENKGVLNAEQAAARRMGIKQREASYSLTMASSVFGDIAQLQSSESKKAARVGKAAAIAQTTIKTYEAATSAYASLAGIPYVGPALGIAAAAAAIAAGLANVRKIQSSSAGFQSGGYTGNAGTADVAGVVHGKEFVINARATAKNRALLERINAGYADGGYVTPLANGAGQMGRGGSARMGGGVVVENNISITTGSVDSPERANELLREVREVVRSETRTTVAEQLRRGNILNPVR